MPSERARVCWDREAMYGKGLGGEKNGEGGRKGERRIVLRFAYVGR